MLRNVNLSEGGKFFPTDFVIIVKGAFIMPLMKGGIPMKNLLILLLAFILTAPAVMAEEVILSPDLLALQRANQSLMDKYGHTHETLGLFHVSLQCYGEQYLITYRSNGSVPGILTGEYIAIVLDEDIHVIWTHDNADAALWQSGELTSPAWGVKQLTAYLDEHPYTRADFCTPYESAALASAESAAIGGSVPFNELTPEDRAAADEACLLARKAVQIMYGLPDDVVTRLDWPVDMTTVAHCPDGHTKWHIMLQDNVADILDPITYYVTLNGDTGEILRVIHASGGVG